MAQDQKQKVLIAILAVFALGAGSYYFFIRDSSVGAQAVATSGATERRVRKEPTEAKPLKREAKHPEQTAERTAPERPEREKKEAPTVTRRQPKDEKNEVKKKAPPKAG